MDEVDGDGIMECKERLRRNYFENVKGRPPLGKVGNKRWVKISKVLTGMWYMEMKWIHVALHKEVM